MMITEDLGAGYVLDSYRHRWFRRPLDGRVYRLENIEQQSRSNYVVWATPLEGTFPDVSWGEHSMIPAAEFEDMSSFSHPQLGYRHTINGAGLYFFNRRISTHRGLHNGNLEVQPIARASNAGDLTSERKVSLVYDGPMMPMVQAINQLNTRGATTRGFAITPQFAICRKTGDRDTYALHYNGREAGTCDREGTTTFRVEAVKRLFDKVA